MTEYQRRWAAENRERVAENQHRWYMANRERIAEQRRQYYEANEDRIREYKRQYYEKNRARQIERARQQRLNGYRGPRERRAAEATARLLQEQGGRCYLCEELMPLDQVVIEHDHRCCPNRTFCSYCIRGAACQTCNRVIGRMRDDPVLLERVARNLRIKRAEVDERMAALAKDQS